MSNNIWIKMSETAKFTSSKLQVYLYYEQHYFSGITNRLSVPLSLPLLRPRDSLASHKWVRVEQWVSGNHLFYWSFVELHGSRADCWHFHVCHWSDNQSDYRSKFLAHTVVFVKIQVCAFVIFVFLSKT